MGATFRLLAVIVALLARGAAWAQESPGRIGANCQDVTKAEADKLGWEAARGGKIKPVAPGSPADKAGLKEGPIVDLIDGREVETATGFAAALASKPKGTNVW